MPKRASPYSTGCVLNKLALDDAGNVGFDPFMELHGFDNAENLARRHVLAIRTKGGDSGECIVERADDGALGVEEQRVGFWREESPLSPSRRAEQASYLPAQNRRLRCRRRSAADSPPAKTDRALLRQEPIVGTYYEATSPESPPFVRIGEHVTPGKVLCIIESMKLMNEIEADVAGIIESKLVQNGQPVEYGEALFGIRPV